ncbi:MAG TPA: GntR family transcriptional regulator [Candidatus Limnocylindria bacterium]|nr:GntR family transcriptional regulator [Candidatus Limnocylindria bacterium]
MALRTAVPHYQRIELAMRERIATLQAGDELPSDAELCAEFGVSRMTARNAMQRLAGEGLIVREPGRGSFVAERPVHRRANQLMTFTHEMERQGRLPSSRVLERHLRPATEAEAERLGLLRGAKVVVLRRLRCADGVPLAVETAVLEGRAAEAAMNADLEHGSLHEALTDAGHTLRRGTATIGAEPATREDAELLDVRLGQPLLVERRVILDAAARPIEATESRYAGERYALDVTFDVEQPGRPDGA